MDGVLIDSFESSASCESNPPVAQEWAGTVNTGCSWAIEVPEL